MIRPKPIAAFLLASVTMLVLTGCPHRHRDHYPPPPEHHDGDHHDNDHHDDDHPR
jgi:hypothetical protein